MKRPLITIGITCFNSENTIERAIASALDQTWDNSEIIIVDDGSTDHSIQIISEYIANYPNVQFIPRERNKGFPSALNLLIASAKGEFIAFFDDDDQSHPERLEEQFKRITEYEIETKNKLVLCYTNRNVISIGNQDITSQRLAIGRTAPEPVGSMVADNLLCRITQDNVTWGKFGSCTLMLRLSTAKSVGDFDIEFKRSAELDFAVRAAFKGAAFIAVNKPMINQYLTEGAHKSLEITFKYTYKLLKKHRSYLKSKKFYLSSILFNYSILLKKKKSPIFFILWPITNIFYYVSSKITKKNNKF